MFARPHHQVSKLPEKHKLTSREVEEVEKSNLLKIEKVTAKPKSSPNKKSKEVEKTFLRTNKRVHILINLINQSSSINKVIKGKSKVISGGSLSMEDQNSSGPSSIIPLLFLPLISSIISQ